MDQNRIKSFTALFYLHNSSPHELVFWAAFTIVIFCPVQVKDNFSEDVTRTLNKIANKETDNKFSRYIDKNEHAKACDVAISVLSLVDQSGHSSKSQVSQQLNTWRLKVMIVSTSALIPDRVVRVPSLLEALHCVHGLSEDT